MWYKRFFGANSSDLKKFERTLSLLKKNIDPTAELGIYIRSGWNEYEYLMYIHIKDQYEPMMMNFLSDFSLVATKEPESQLLIFKEGVDVLNKKNVILN